ncbi:MAG: ROK family protein [Prevotella sp.]|nr:ROK family protein [Prevotella sp.]
MEYQEETIKTRVVGVDISIDRTTIAIVNIRGKIIAESNFDTSDYPDVNNYIIKLSEEILKLVEANGGYETIRSVGISAPSASFTSGCIINSPNLPWKGTIPLAAMLRDQLGLAVALGNDAHVAALGEKAFGSAHGMSDFILVTLGGGVGSCFFSAGREHQGYDGMAGEIGHTCIVDNGRQCGCGNKGCLEAYTNAKGIVLTARELMAASDEPSLMRNLETLTPLTIKECCDRGDAMAIEVYRKTGYILGIGLASYASVINPQAIILTGGISHAGKWLMQPMVESFEQHILMNMRGRVKFLTSKLNNHERDVLGASVLAWQVKEYSLFL